MKMISMKISTFLLTFLISVSQLFGQAPPEAFNYSGAARDGSGNPLSEETIGVEFSILESSASGTVVYREQHTVLTDIHGVFNLGIGLGSVQEGDFSAISWGGNSYFLKVGIDPAGGTSYTTTGTTQLLSVPYALYAKKAGSSNGGLKPIVDLFKNNGYEYSDSNAKIFIEGIVYSEGSSAVTERGFVWSTNPNPTITDNKLILDSGGGIYQGDLIVPISDIYYKAYAINENGAAYSHKDYKAKLSPLNIDFRIEDFVKNTPFLLTVNTHYENSGNIVHYGPEVCWDTIPDSRNHIACVKLSLGSTPELTDKYSTTIEGLLPGKTYYFTPKLRFNVSDAMDAVYYGEESSFTNDLPDEEIEGMYVGTITQSSTDIMDSVFVDTAYVTVNISTETAIFKSNFWGEQLLEVDLDKSTNNIINNNLVEGIQFSNTSTRLLEITAAYTDLLFKPDGLDFVSRTTMRYTPRNPLDRPLGIIFKGNYTKQ